jgi:Uma2 family endonuclease
LDVILDEHNVVEPDIIYVSNARRSIITKKNIQGPPDLLIEAISPSTSTRDLRDKRNIYSRCGVPNYWLLDPDARSVTELELIEKAYAVVSESAGSASLSPKLFPGLSISLVDLWE